MLSMVMLCYMRCQQTRSRSSLSSLDEAVGHVLEACVTENCGWPLILEGGLSPPKTEAVSSIIIGS